MENKLENKADAVLVEEKDFRVPGMADHVEAHEISEPFWRDRRGIGTVEMILILVVLIALVLIFKTQLNDLVKTIFNAISKSTKSVIK